MALSGCPDMTESLLAGMLNNSLNIHLVKPVYIAFFLGRIQFITSGKNRQKCLAFSANLLLNLHV